MKRIATCQSCGLVFEAGARGYLPRYCPECRYRRQLEASKRWKGRNQSKVLDYRREYDADPEHRERNIERARRFRERNGKRITVYRQALYVARQQAGNTARVRAYRRANPGKHSEIEARRRFRLIGQFVAPVNVAEIRTRDEGLCGICGLAVPVEQQSLDHIMPLALGGTHEPANVQLAHRVCNSRKGAKERPYVASHDPRGSSAGSA